MRGVNSSVDTVNAAANAIISADSRVQQVTVPRRRWGACLGLYWCFGSPRHTKRINHAVLVPEPISSGHVAPPPPENPSHAPSLTLPFIAPPSSPASFLNSEPTSSAPSPGGGGGFPSLSALSANAYSPTRPSIFVRGPYAHETQLVSPPVFSSTLTTEPNTASVTPHPESVQITNPSSPEVPFARLLSSSFDSNQFPAYHLYPGSPIGHLISPSSVCSGTSSPFPDREILAADILADRRRELFPHNSSRRRHGSILDGHIPALTFGDDDGSSANHRVSFELTAEEVARCIERKPAKPGEAVFESEFITKREGNGGAGHSDETRHESPERIESSGELVASKEFKFSNSDGVGVADTSVGSEWWVNEKVVAAEAVPTKNWAFFPMVQPGVS